MKLKTLIYVCLFITLATSCKESIIEPEVIIPAKSELKSATIGTTYYVAKSGSDSNTGTITAPFLTIQKAANIVNPGDIVIVDDGLYTTTSEAVVKLTRSGTEGNPITFKSKNKWGAKFDGRSNATNDAFIFSKVSYVNLRDFEFKGFAFWTILVDVGSSHIEITGNSIHDIGRLCTDTTYGLVGCYLNEATDIVFSHNVLHDIGRFSTGENGCTNVSNNFKNHDHGLYLNGVTNVTASYNIFYNIHNGQGMHIYSYNNNSSSNINVYNNTFAFGNSFYAAGHIMIWCSLTNSVIANNIFYSQAGSGLQIYQGSFTYSNVQIKNNITYLGTGKVNDGTATGVTLLNNFNSTDPKMINPAGYDFRLQSTSPDINNGINVGLATDILDCGIVSLPDIGAYEYAGIAPIAPVVSIPPVVPVEKVYYNITTSATATKNSCGSDYTGSVVTYIIPSNKYSSTVSQADADSKATLDLNTNKQAYANANGVCTIIPVYFNTAISATATKNNCGTGYTGSTTIYTISSNKYSSVISQADADSKAASDLNANKQTYANTNGTCTIIPTTIFYNVTMSATATKNSCGTGYTGSKVTYTVSSGEYSSTVSQVDANAKASADLNANRQTYANMNGTCTKIRSWRRH